MPEGCVFCRIVAGEAEARMVYEDDATAAFLDVNPLARGHTLVVPTDHHETLEDLPAGKAIELMETIHRLVPEIEAAVEADATTVGINNGTAAGQEIDHVHAHIIPRFRGDGGRPIHAVAGGKPALTDEELDDVAEDIAALVDETGD
ncbi:MAG: HIT family protein [Halodesulfurarchaeum sp.]